MDEPRLIVYAAWAVGSVVTWGRVFIDAVRTYRASGRGDRRQDTRAWAFREMVSDFSLFLVALASAAALVAFIFGAEIPGLRGFTAALALGAFLGAGLIRQPPFRPMRSWVRFRAWARR